MYVILQNEYFFCGVQIISFGGVGFDEKVKKKLIIMMRMKMSIKKKIKILFFNLRKTKFSTSIQTIQTIIGYLHTNLQIDILFPKSIMHIFIKTF